jgi:hypothetical protein
VTYNLKDFPAETLARFDIEALHPDDFLVSLLDQAPGMVCAAERRDVRVWRRNQFLLSDGKVAEKLHLPEQALTLEAVIRRYVEVHSNGAMEENSLQTVEMHLRHVTESLGAAFAINRLKQDNLQAHIDRRAKKKGIHKRKLSPVTLGKELASFRALWNWSVKSGLLTGPFPNQGLVFPKTEEKPPFQTWEEIERQVSRGGMAPADEKALWDSLFLTVPQIHEILEHVRGQKLQPFVYPMFCFAAHTGARRSEMLRCRGRRKGGGEKGTQLVLEVHSFPFFFGRPGGRSVCVRPKSRTASCCQAAEPNDPVYCPKRAASPFLPPLSSTHD